MLKENTIVMALSSVENTCIFARIPMYSSPPTTIEYRDGFQCAVILPWQTENNMPIQDAIQFIRGIVDRIARRYNLKPIYLGPKHLEENPVTVILYIGFQKFS